MFRQNFHQSPSFETKKLIKEDEDKSYKKKKVNRYRNGVLNNIFERIVIKKKYKDTETEC